MFVTILIVVAALVLVVFLAGVAISLHSDGSFCGMWLGWEVCKVIGWIIGGVLHIIAEAASNSGS